MDLANLLNRSKIIQDRQPVTIADVDSWRHVMTADDGVDRMEYLKHTLYHMVDAGVKVEKLHDVLHNIRKCLEDELTAVRVSKQRDS